MRKAIVAPVAGLSMLAMVVAGCAETTGGAIGAGAATAAGLGKSPGKGALVGAGIGAAAGAIYDITKKK